MVPYSPYLYQKYQCDINVEKICTSVKSVKYLYKYTYKGCDRASLTISVDEVKRYLDTIYVGSPKEYWRLFEFAIGDKSYAIEWLAVNLPDRQVVNHTERGEADALEQEKAARTAGKISGSLKINHRYANLFPKWRCGDKITMANIIGWTEKRFFLLLFCFMSKYLVVL